MNKTEFLEALEKALAGLPREDVTERVNFYSEMIDDRLEEGLTEEQATADLGSAEEIALQTLEDIPLARLVKDKVTPKRRMKAWEIVLLVLGFPVWFPLVVTAFVLLVALYLVLWVLVGCLWIIDVSFALAGVGGIAAGVMSICRGEATNGLMLIGAGLLLIGLAVFLYFACIAATKGAVKLTKKTALWIKTLIVGKEKTK